LTTWKCHDCEAQFNDPDTALFRAGRIGNGSENWEKDEYIDVCPVCGSEEIYEAYFCADCEKEVDEGELDEDDLCLECAAKSAAYDEMVDRVNEALSTPIDWFEIAKKILTKPKAWEEEK
jgi:DNA-directed RNA polymerase subunit RPC12/RpoP